MREGKYDKLSDEALQAEADRDNATKADKVRHCRILYERALKRRSQAMWQAGAMLLAPLGLLSVLLNYSFGPLFYVAFGIMWASLAAWGFKFERYALRDVEDRSSELASASAVESAAAKALDDRRFSKRMSQKDAEWQAFKTANPEQAKALRDKYLG